MITFGIAINKDKDKNGLIKKSITETTLRVFPDSKVVILNLDESDDKILSDLSYYIVLGGDGTILAAARRLNGRNIPILGVNIGHLGFLAAVEITEYEKALKLIKNKKYSIEKRTMLKASFKRGEKTVNMVAMNDIVITKGSLGKIMKYEIFIDGNYATSFRGDGLILATPTGSTAYNLSAGGPIVYPTVSAIAITAICPHTLGLRNMIVNASSKIQVVVSSDLDRYFISVDGQENSNIPMETPIVVTESEHSANILRLDDYDYFDVLRRKIVNKAQDI